MSTEAKAEHLAVFQESPAKPAVQVTSNMTPLERHNAIARAMGGGEIAEPKHTGMGPQIIRDAQSPDHVALDQAYADALHELEAEKSKLPSTQYEARRNEIKRNYEKQLTGVFAAHVKALKAPPPSAR